MRKVLSLVAILCLLVFAVLVVRWPPGTDSYFIASHIRAGTFHGYHPLFYTTLAVLPWSIWLMKIVPVILMFSVAVTAGLIAGKLDYYYSDDSHAGDLSATSTLGKFKKMFECKAAWITSLLVFGFPVFIYRGAVFEEDLLGMFFCFMAVYFVIDYFFEEESLFCVLSCFVAGLFCWKGAVFFIPFFVLLGLRRKKLLLFFAPLFFGCVLLVLLCTGIPLPNMNVAEAVPGVLTAVFSWGFGLAGLCAARYYNGFLRWFVIYFSLWGFYLSRFQLLGVVPLSVGLYFLLKYWGGSETRSVSLLGFTLVFNRTKSFLNMLLLVGLLVGYGVLLFKMVPTGEQMQCMEKVVEFTGTDEIANEWRYGHWLKFFGGSPLYSPLHNYDDLENTSAEWLFGDCDRHECLIVFRCQESCLYRC